MRIILFAVIILESLIGNSQNIAVGIVYDEENYVIPFAEVNYTADNIKKKDTSDINGVFKIEYNYSPEIILELYPVGYEYHYKKVNLEEVDTVKLVVPVYCMSGGAVVGKDMAMNDINKGQFYIYHEGGIAPVIPYLSEEFSSKYNLYHNTFGCNPISVSCIDEYNKTIYKYMDDAYGEEWRREYAKAMIPK